MGDERYFTVQVGDGVQALVIDSGSGMGKAGFPGERDSAVGVPFHRRATASATWSRSTRTNRCCTPACGRTSPRGCAFATSAERKIVRDVKEKLAYFARDFEEELKKHTTTINCNISCGLPDGNEIMKYNIDVRKDLNANLVLSGESTMFQSGVRRRSSASHRRH
jgi:hypothetical protein